MQIADALRPALRRWNLAELDAHAGAIYGVHADLRIGYFNDAWDRFADANGGEPRITTEWPLGRSLWAKGFPRETSHGLCTACFRFHYPVGY